VEENIGRKSISEFGRTWVARKLQRKGKKKNSLRLPAASIIASLPLPPLNKSVATLAVPLSLSDRALVLNKQWFPQVCQLRTPQVLFRKLSSRLLPLLELGLRRGGFQWIHPQCSAAGHKRAILYREQQGRTNIARQGGRE